MFKIDRLKNYLGINMVLFFGIISFVLFIPNYLYAQGATPDPVPATGQTADTSGFANPDVKKLQEAATKELNKANIKNPQTLIGRIIKALFIPMGFIALLLVVVAGIMYMTAAGNAEKTKKATNIIVWVFMGMTAMLVSYMLVAVLFKFLSS